MRGKPKPPPAWRWIVTSSALNGELAVAATKSEARAAIKRRRGLARLPAGCVLRKLGGVQ